MFLSFCGKVPRNEGAAFVAPNATVQGDVILKAGSTVWYGAVLRGDDGQLIIGENSNVQDNAVLHCDVGGAVTLGRNVTVGHSALVHGCTVGDVRHGCRWKKNTSSSARTFRRWHVQQQRPDPQQRRQNHPRP